MFKTLCLAAGLWAASPCHALDHELYVAVDSSQGARIYKYDIHRGHQLIGTLDLPGMATVRGITGHSGSSRLFVSADGELAAFDLTRGVLLWRKPVTPFGDRADVTRDGRHLLLPTGWRSEDDKLLVVDTETGNVLQKLTIAPQVHNTYVSPIAPRAYVSSLASPYIFVIDLSRFPYQVERRIGPFSASVRPYVVDAAEERIYANVDHLLGFEIADARTGDLLTRVEVPGFPVLKPVKHKPCPSHGLALTPDQSELWVVNNPGRKVHVFSNSPSPQLKETIELSGNPGWITFSRDGAFAYPSTGDVIDTFTRQIVGTLKDETGARVESEKLLEIEYNDWGPVHVGSQYGTGVPGALPPIL